MITPDSYFFSSAIIFRSTSSTARSGSGMTFSAVAWGSKSIVSKMLPRVQLNSSQRTGRRLEDSRPYLWTTSATVLTSPGSWH